jgi:hypothetical protein
MTEQHPVTPPTELLDQWCMSSELGNWRDIAICAAQWGADQELEACCAYMQHEDFHGFATELRAARRPKPPSLKEQALDALRDSPVDPVDETLQLSADAELIIRRALEALDD